ncbi:uncharacterized protein LAJ45_02303 [Morchella importuna]|uniref:uncharacterized protein n=1 Tax=Morchella importuna TaxID=1174673 RepID=UPI001E8D6FAD|nr:uncharacterized protein LAJ45_02303 [Morchella importuna]KAH8153490.1 hypothetical protein LAJ45_02303 [Morchella importuna]
MLSRPIRASQQSLWGFGAAYTHTTPSERVIIELTYRITFERERRHAGNAGIHVIYMYILLLHLSSVQFEFIASSAECMQDGCFKYNDEAYLQIALTEGHILNVYAATKKEPLCGSTLARYKTWWRPVQGTSSFMLLSRQNKAFRFFMSVDKAEKLIQFASTSKAESMIQGYFIHCCSLDRNRHSTFTGVPHQILQNLRQLNGATPLQCYTSNILVQIGNHTHNSVCGK